MDSGCSSSLSGLKDGKGLPDLRDRRILILLGGPTASGKTTVSSFLANRLGIPMCINTDVIRQVMRFFVPKEDNTFLHLGTYEAGEELNRVRAASHMKELREACQLTEDTGSACESYISPELTDTAEQEAVIGFIAQANSIRNLTDYLVGG
uniref:Zeta toxin domain-containing protein n=1 Tax=Chromera velia CCMP2878 TaxID=1169474 RepID=A0A0G4HU79_9ALVE|eukprot:Cvel_31759.t1-p1 / transcript=Cvel_31759.t1 / gene=Cvel_31759 / organism=Chromera_velia_CCMP2878 / gene_product=hypothetical protein / transcript_product=hypothetical protein / location=Cvel_scaffold4790:6143-7167(+) / protein_length=150 / sequence_SO=supercontig / SO=protein_coding / is_pseudo=false